ncbi:hypothetical protein [Ensifer sp. LCM 4579]|uniref:hypothetical protein n=1 Tax=Ensifer sp. LCM 4579 TaxID=1848292 RepID=UPI0008DA3A5A|nr:hypothetical protein LCM4579_21090 [Ensifer sp. LCM 4579]
MRHRQLGKPAAVTLLTFVVLSATSALSDDPKPSRCRVAPDTDARTLSEKLDDCNGVLKPPKVGDTELVEPAPDVGKTRVIRPGELPAQQSGPNAGEATAGVDWNSSYNVQELVDAIGRSGATARTLSSLTAPQIRVLDVSFMFSGAKAAALNTSLAEHAQALDALRETIANSDPLSQALKSKGLSATSVVAAKVEQSGAVTIFAR